MNRMSIVFLLALPQTAAAERIKKKQPMPAEAERLASDMAINDSLLRKGDIVATDRGFLLYRGLAHDGLASGFVAVPNPTHKAQAPIGR
jgi:hypothetical protein